MINPSFLSLYEYKVKQDDETVNVIFECPITFNPDSVHLKTVENNGIIVYFEGHAPIFAGIPFTDIQDPELKKEEGKIILTLKKVEPKDWPVIITAPTQPEGIIDPKSAYIMGSVLLEGMEEQNEENINLGTKVMMASVSMRYPRALWYVGSKLLSNEETFNKGIIYLNIGAEQYDNVECLCVLLVELMKRDQVTDNIVNRLIPHAEKGNKGAAALLGALFSPISDVSYHNKDADLAVKFLSIATQEPPDPRALFYLADMYTAGVGVEKDEEKGRQMKELACQFLPLNGNGEDGQEIQAQNNQNNRQHIHKTPQEEVPEEKPKYRGLIIAGTIACFTAFGVLFWRSTRK